jgi:hypothetical protein
MANVAVSVVSYVLLFILISGLDGTVEFHEFKKPNDLPSLFISSIVN